MSCWRCGRDIPGVECIGACAPAESPQTPTPPPVKLILIDWQKVQSFEDFKLILDVFGFGVVPGSIAHQKLKRWLKD